MGSRLANGRLAGAALLTIIVAGLEPAQGQSVVLKPKLAPGSTFYVELHQVCDRKVTGGSCKAEGTETRIEWIFGARQTVESLPDDSCRIHLVYDRLGFSFESRSAQEKKESWSFDSDFDGPNEGTPELAEVLLPMLGKPMVMELDDEIHVKSFTGMKEIFESIEKSVGDNPFIGGWKVGLSDEASRAIWGDARMVLFSNKDVVVGDTWQRGYRQPCASAGPLRFDYDCHVKEIAQVDGREIALVAYHAKITPSPGDDENGSQIGSFAVENLSGVFEGVGTFDVELGDFVVDTGKLTLTIDFVLPSSEGGDPQTLKVEQVCDVVTRVLTVAHRDEQRNENLAKAKERRRQREQQLADKKNVPQISASPPRK